MACTAFEEDISGLAPHNSYPSLLSQWVAPVSASSTAGLNDLIVLLL